MHSPGSKSLRLAEETSTSGRSDLSPGWQLSIAELQKLAAASMSFPKQNVTGPPTLHSCLALYFEDFVDCGEEAADCLDMEEKLALLAIARRKGGLTDAALSMLCDSQFKQLELSYSQVTAEQLLKALRQMPRLEHLSTIGILLSAELVASLSSLCPRLQSLRLGGLLDSARSVGRALERQLPSLATAEVSSGLDSWEEADVDMDESQGSTKLQELRYIIWPDAPEKQLARLQAPCPRLVINARQRAFASTSKLKLPVEADMRRPLDVEYAAMVSQLPIDESSEEEEEQPKARSRLRTGELSISERFRLAYQARSERKALKAERNRKQAWRRYVRSNPSEQLIRMAENGVQLFRR